MKNAPKTARNQPNGKHGQADPCMRAHLAENIAGQNAHRSRALFSNCIIPGIKPVAPTVSGESPFTRQHESVRHQLGSATAPSFWYAACNAFVPLSRLPSQAKFVLAGSG